MARSRHGAGLIRNFLCALCLFASALFAQSASAMDFFARTDPEYLPADVRDLPLVVTEAQSEASGVFVVWISGDGGWSILEREIVARLAASGVSTVAINSFLYFSVRRDPRRVGIDLARVAESFGKRWRRSRIIFVGYSFGADSGPAAFAADPGLQARFSAAILLSPSLRTYQQRRPSSWLGLGGIEDNVAALNRLNGNNVVCVRGVDDAQSACREINRPRVAQIALPGGHTLHGGGPAIANLILEVARAQTTAR